MRVVLDEAQQAAIHQGVVLTDDLYEKLVDWVNTNYREQIAPEDLRDPKLVDESRRALEALEKLLAMPLLDE